MKYPTFASLQAREKTFNTWPAKQATNEMIEAGFFYSGKSDVVYCFYCGLGLHEWEQSDEPRAEHIKWSKHCGYIRTDTSDEGIDVCGNMSDEVSDHPPRDTLKCVQLKRRNTI